jgi:hypothetical protein
MRLHKIATGLHRWLAAIIGLQIIIWFASGTIMAFLPIEKVRGEHLLRKMPGAALPARDMPALLAGGWAALPQQPTRAEIYMLLGRPVLLAEFDNAAHRMLIDMTTARPISPLPRRMALRLVRESSTLPLTHPSALWITKKSTEYRGDVPAWRIDAHDPDEARFYVDPFSGKVKPVRTGLWRFYDFIWGLHIMDWKNHDDTNGILLTGFGGLAIFVAIAGIFLLFFRVFGPAWRRHKRRRNGQSQI